VESCDRDPNRTLAVVPIHQNGNWDWQQISAREALLETSGLARRLYSLGVDKGVPVAIVAETSHLWSALDVAILSLGGITVGIYPTLLGPDIAWQLRHAEVQILIVEDFVQYKKIEPELDALENLLNVLSMKECDDCPVLTAAQPDPDFLRERISTLTPEHVATIVYTSGTTGEPKGVMLKHGHFLANIAASRAVLPIQRGERSIVFLPLAHALQRFAQYVGFVDDCEGWYAPSIKDLPATIEAARPHVLATVPRMLEKIRATILAKAAQRGPVASNLLSWAISVGKTYRKHKYNGTKVPWRLKQQHTMAKRMVFDRIQEGLGGHIRLFVSGGAALSVEVASWFEAIGIDVREGWGLTETTAPATLNGKDNPRQGSVGQPIPGVELALAEDGEILVRGPGVFNGYLKNPQATAAAFTPGGFFRTGDIGSIDEDGFLYILDRKKEIIVTAGGKNIAPSPIEKHLEGGLLGQVVLFGSERPFLVALIVPEEDALTDLATENNWPGGFKEWSQHPDLQQQISQHVADRNAELPSFKTVKKFAIVDQLFSVDGGELTATLKLRRRIIRQKYQSLIDALYE